MVIDFAAISDVDYTAAGVLNRVTEQLPQTTSPPRRQQRPRPRAPALDRYGISAALGPGAYYDTPGEALEAFHAAQGVTGE